MALHLSPSGNQAPISIAPIAGQNIIDLATARMGELCQATLKSGLQEIGSETRKYCTGTHPEQVRQAEEKAKQEAEIAKQEQDLRRLAEEVKESIKQQLAAGQILDQKALKMVEHIADMLKDSEITLGLQDELRGLGVEYTPKAVKAQKTQQVLEPIQFAGALQSDSDREEAA